jgi:hypothetical protein
MQSHVGIPNNEEKLVKQTLWSTDIDFLIFFTHTAFTDGLHCVV